MQNRIKGIYEELYGGVKGKKYLADRFGVTTKTIENTVAKMEGEVVYDKKLGGYRFSSLLPRQIPHHRLIGLLQSSISNETARQDFLTLSSLLREQGKDNLPMIPTSAMSPMTRKLIMLEVAIRSNCIVRIDYTGNEKPMETKYVKPHRINTSENSYYLYGSYDGRNEKNIGEYRSFAVNGITEIEPVEWIKGETFYIESEGNAYGIITREKWVVLHLKGSAANYFKRERQFSRPQFDFVSEEPDNTVMMKMYYNNIIEVVKLIQQWMPYISIDEASPQKEKIYEKIRANIRQLIPEA